MGVASDVTAALVEVPVSSAEVSERRDAASVRDGLTTKLDGSIVERATPAKEPVQAPQPATWD